MSSNAPTPAPTTDITPAATVAKKSKAIHVVTGFLSMPLAVLLLVALAVCKSLTNNPAFSAPPVPMATFTTHVSALQDAMTAMEQNGGKTEVALQTQCGKVVAQDLKLLAVYVENVCNDNPAVFATSGFTAKSKVKVGSQPVNVPSFKSLFHGKNSGQVVFGINGVTGGKSYNFRYAVMTGGLPGNWTTMPVGAINKKLTISNLTPGTLYGFQVQALGALGLSDWSTTATIMAI